MSGHLMKFETPFSDHDYEDFSNHDISNGVTIDNVDVAGGQYKDWDLDQGRMTLRRNSRKPQPFVSENPKKKTATKHKKSTEGPKRRKNVGKKAKKNGKEEEQSTKYEVDYIFGKRPDKDRKGKWEYRVLWKNFPRSDATWEPRENLRYCNEAIKAYEQGQLEEEIEKDDEMEGGNGKNENVTMRKKEDNKKFVRSRSITEPKAEKKVLSTMRTRSVSVPKQVVGKGRGGCKKSNKETEASPALSHSTSDSSGSSTADVKSKKGNLPVKKKKIDNKGDKSQQQSTSHLANTDSRSRAKSESVSSKESRNSDVQNIAMVESVFRSDVVGVGLVAKVIFKDGLIKKIRVDDFKAQAPMVLIEYYERELGLLM